MNDEYPVPKKFTTTTTTDLKEEDGLSPVTTEATPGVGRHV